MGYEGRQDDIVVVLHSLSSQCFGLCSVICNLILLWYLQTSSNLIVSWYKSLPMEGEPLWLERNIMCIYHYVNK